MDLAKIEAPFATDWSGSKTLISASGYLAAMAFLTWGILEDPPTRMTSSMSAMVNSLEASTLSMRSMVVWTRPAEAASNSSLVMV